MNQVDKEYIKNIIETESRSKSNTKRLDTLESKVEDIHNLTLSVREIATEMKMMREDVNKIDKRVLAIEDKPSKKMDQLWGYIVGALVGGMIAYCLMKMGLK